MILRQISFSLIINYPFTSPLPLISYLKKYFPENFFKFFLYIYFHLFLHPFIYLRMTAIKDDAGKKLQDQSDSRILSFTG